MTTTTAPPIARPPLVTTPIVELTPTTAPLRQNSPSPSRTTKSTPNRAMAATDRGPGLPLPVSPRGHVPDSVTASDSHFATLIAVASWPPVPGPHPLANSSASHVPVHSHSHSRSPLPPVRRATQILGHVVYPTTATCPPSHLPRYSSSSGSERVCRPRGVSRVVWAVTRACGELGPAMATEARPRVGVFARTCWSRQTSTRPTRGYPHTTRTQSDGAPVLPRSTLSGSSWPPSSSHADVASPGLQRWDWDWDLQSRGRRWRARTFRVPWTVPGLTGAPRTDVSRRVPHLYARGRSLSNLPPTPFFVSPSPGACAICLCPCLRHLGCP